MRLNYRELIQPFCIKLSAQTLLLCPCPLCIAYLDSQKRDLSGVTSTQYAVGQIQPASVLSESYSLRMTIA